jgi:N-sulfoglucosamine sulfohydrolase
MAPTMLEIAGISVPDNMQGRSRLRMFLDPDSLGRRYAFSERNWHDIDDHVRSVLTDRFRYIRNYYPDERLPHPADTTSGDSYQAMRRLRDAGELTAQQMLIFRVPRPAEELYDIEEDPYEFHDVAGKEEYHDVLEELRGVLDRWVEDTHDVSPTKRMVDMYDWETGKRTDPRPRRLREIHEK